MPNWCDLELRVLDGGCEELREFISGKDSMGRQADVTFHKLIPMPDNIFRGDLGEEERKLYGKYNWYDWSIEHWGTKWDACHVQYTPECVMFSTAWCPPFPWLEKLAERAAINGRTIKVNTWSEGMCKEDAFKGYLLQDGALSEDEVDDDFISGYDDLYNYEEED